jgi:dihydroflavonol-4-reductase
MRRVNVDGTAGLLAAARLAGIERAVLTSSSSTMHPDAQNGDTRRSSYHASKILQERAAFSSRVPVVAILPTAPIGPRDHKPTPTGKMVLDFIRGKMFARPPGDGGMNLVAVEDVARVHVAALQRGRIGERYVVGGENLSFDRIWELLAALSGRAVPSWHVPYALALGVAQLDELRCRLDSGARPFAPPEGVRLSRTRMFADSTMAENELGHRPTPIDAALERAIAWYRDNGYAN